MIWVSLGNPLPLVAPSYRIQSPVIIKDIANPNTSLEVLVGDTGGGLWTCQMSPWTPGRWTNINLGSAAPPWSYWNLLTPPSRSLPVANPTKQVQDLVAVNLNAQPDSRIQYFQKDGQVGNWQKPPNSGSKVPTPNNSTLIGQVQVSFIPTDERLQLFVVGSVPPSTGSPPLVLWNIVQDPGMTTWASAPINPPKTGQKWLLPASTNSVAVWQNSNSIDLFLLTTDGVFQATQSSVATAWPPWTTLPILDDSGAQILFAGTELQISANKGGTTLLLGNCLQNRPGNVYAITRQGSNWENNWTRLQLKNTTLQGLAATSDTSTGTMLTAVYGIDSCGSIWQVGQSIGSGGALVWNSPIQLGTPNSLIDFDPLGQLNRPSPFIFGMSQLVCCIGSDGNLWRGAV